VLQVVSVKLAKHVVKNQEKLIAGIGNVTAVEDDLQVRHHTLFVKGTLLLGSSSAVDDLASRKKSTLPVPLQFNHLHVLSLEDSSVQAAYTIIQSSRTQLKLAAEEVQSQIKVVAYTRKKQSYMTALEACTKIKKAKDLPALLK
jgi:hypothetical protein